VQRLIEQPVDEGEVWEGASCLGRVRYHLSVYQQFSELEGEPVPASLDVEGHITPQDPIELADLHQRHAELSLRLADGRTLDFTVADPEGAIRSTGRGLFQQ
jgi:hypothetical protein